MGSRHGEKPQRRGPVCRPVLGRKEHLSHTSLRTPGPGTRVRLPRKAWIRPGMEFSTAACALPAAQGLALQALPRDGVCPGRRPLLPHQGSGEPQLPPPGWGPRGAPGGQADSSGSSSHGPGWADLSRRRESKTPPCKSIPQRGSDFPALVPHYHSAGVPGHLITANSLNAAPRIQQTARDASPHTRPAH